MTDSRQEHGLGRIGGVGHILGLAERELRLMLLGHVLNDAEQLGHLIGLAIPDIRFGLDHYETNLSARRHHPEQLAFRLLRCGNTAQHGAQLILILHMDTGNHFTEIADELTVFLHKVIGIKTEGDDHTGRPDHLVTANLPAPMSQPRSILRTLEMIIRQIECPVLIREPVNRLGPTEIEQSGHQSQCRDQHYHRHGDQHGYPLTVPPETKGIGRGMTYHRQIIGPNGQITSFKRLTCAETAGNQIVPIDQQADTAGLTDIQLVDIALEKARLEGSGNNANQIAFLIKGGK